MKDSELPGARSKPNVFVEPTIQVVSNFNDAAKLAQITFSESSLGDHIFSRRIRAEDRLLTIL